MGNDESFKIRWAASADQIPAELWERCFPPPLEGPWWYRVLQRSGLEDEFAFSYAVIEQAGRPVGIAPTFVMNVPLEVVAPLLVVRVLRMGGRLLGRLLYQRTLFVGSPCSDEGTVGLLPGIELGSVAGSLQAALMTKAKVDGAEMVVWKDLPAPAARELARHRRKLRVFPAVSYPGTIVHLPQGGMEAYLKSLPQSRRYLLPKKLRRGRAMGELESCVLQRPDAALLDEIFGLFWQTYQKGSTKFERLNRRFFEVMASEPAGHFILLRRSGRLVAFMLCFRLGRRIINKFIGLDYGLGGEWFLYFQLWAAAVEWAMQCGASELQSGQTGYRAKRDVGHRLVPLTNFCRHMNPLLKRVFARVAKGITWASLDEDLAEHLRAHPEEEQQAFVCGEHSMRA